MKKKEELKKENSIKLMQFTKKEYDYFCQNCMFSDLQEKILEQQSKEIQKQTNYYLEKIIKQNDEILKKLDKLK